MSLHSNSIGIPLHIALRLRPKELQNAFEQFARYSPDSPDKCYHIRVGSRTLFSNDTRDLRIQFGRLIGRLKRRKL